jgi:transcriptional regulator with XRE-family HTH domain
VNRKSERSQLISRHELVTHASSSSSTRRACGGSSSSERPSTSPASLFAISLRKEKGLTHKDLAETVGLNQAQVHRYEKGAAEPSMSALKTLALALGVTTDELRGASSSVPELLHDLVERLDPSGRDVLEGFANGFLLFGGHRLVVVGSVHQLAQQWIPTLVHEVDERLDRLELTFVHVIDEAMQPLTPSVFGLGFHGVRHGWRHS